jgi:hypothetical protein
MRLESGAPQGIQDQAILLGRIVEFPFSGLSACAAQ